MEWANVDQSVWYGREEQPIMTASDQARSQADRRGVGGRLAGVVLSLEMNGR